MDSFISLYRKNFKIPEQATFTKIDHEDGLVAFVYKVDMGKGEFILKICPRSNDFLREAFFLDYFADKISVPKIIDRVEPDKEIAGALLIEYLTGSLLRESEFSNDLGFEIGASLARIHFEKTPGYGDPVLKNLHSDPRIYFSFKFDEGLKECYNHLPKVLTEKCSKYYEDHLFLFDQVDGPCIVHRDFRPGNLIVNQGELQGIIDWASARYSFAEEDFCSVEQENFWPGFDNKALLKGYESVRSLPNYKPLMPLLKLNKAIATLGFLIKTGLWKGKSSKLYQLNRHFLDNFFSWV